MRGAPGERTWLLHGKRSLNSCFLIGQAAPAGFAAGRGVYADVDALFAEADDDVRAIRWGCYARIVVVSAMFEFCSQNKTGPPAAEWGRLISDTVNTPVLDGLDELAIDDNLVKFHELVTTIVKSKQPQAVLPDGQAGTRISVKSHTAHLPKLERRCFAVNMGHGTHGRPMVVTHEAAHGRNNKLNKLCSSRESLSLASLVRRPQKTAALSLLHDNTPLLLEL